MFTAVPAFYFLVSRCVYRCSVAEGDSVRRWSKTNQNEIWLWFCIQTTSWYWIMQQICKSTRRGPFQTHLFFAFAMDGKLPRRLRESMTVMISTLPRSTHVKSSINANGHTWKRGAVSFTKDAETMHLKRAMDSLVHFLPSWCSKGAECLAWRMRKCLLEIAVISSWRRWGTTTRENRFSVTLLSQRERFWQLQIYYSNKQMIPQKRKKERFINASRKNN